MRWRHNNVVPTSSLHQAFSKFATARATAQSSSRFDCKTPPWGCEGGESKLANSGNTHKKTRFAQCSSPAREKMHSDNRLNLDVHAPELSTRAREQRHRPTTTRQKLCRFFTSS